MFLLICLLAFTVQASDLPCMTKINQQLEFVQLDSELPEKNPPFSCGKFKRNTFINTYRKIIREQISSAFLYRRGKNNID